MLARHSHGLVTALVALDALLAAGAFLAAFALRFYTPLLGPAQSPAPIGAYLVALPVVVLVTLSAFHAAGLYRAEALAGGARWSNVRGAALAAVLLLALSALSRDATYSRWVVALLFAFLAAGAPLVRRVIAPALLRPLLGLDPERRRAVVVGEGEPARALLGALDRHWWTGIDVIGTVRAGDEVSRTADRVPSLGTVRDLETIAALQPLNAVLVALPWERAAEVPAIERALRGTSAELHLALDAGPFLHLRPQAGMVGPLPVVTVRGGPGYGWNRVAKRAIDLVIGSIALLVSLPVLAAAALAIRVTSPGAPVLYRQTRVSWGGRPFTMLKLRTMVPEAEPNGPQLTVRDDPRCTRLGWLLRRTSIDELPQLWNVLRGDMSLVGPRPERPELLPRIAEALPHYPLRLSVKAGITGLAQIAGKRGDTPFDERLRLDLRYVQRWSLALDLEIIARTALGGFLSRHAI